MTRSSGELGRARRVDTTRAMYQEFCRSTLPAGVTLAGLKIVVDCANGAAYKVAPRVLADLGADIVPIGSSPNGRNINVGCGSTAPELLQLTVPGVHAQVGIALDGDGDRLLMVDHLGRIVDGDQLLFIIACARHEQGALPGPVVGTQMSNLGLELALRKRGIAFERAAVGDRYVLARLRETGGVLGGETSGHILCLDRTTTGDGLVSALQVLAVMQQSRKSLAELASGMTRLPQVMLNVEVAERFDPLTVPEHQGPPAFAGEATRGSGPGGPARLGNRAPDPGHGRGPGGVPGPSLRRATERRRARGASPRARAGPYRAMRIARTGAHGYDRAPRNGPLTLTGWNLKASHGHPHATQDCSRQLEDAWIARGKHGAD